MILNVKKENDGDLSMSSLNFFHTYTFCVFILFRFHASPCIKIGNTRQTNTMQMKNKYKILIVSAVMKENVPCLRCWMCPINFGKIIPMWTQFAQKEWKKEMYHVSYSISLIERKKNIQKQMYFQADEIPKGEGNRASLSRTIGVEDQSKIEASNRASSVTDSELKKTRPRHYICGMLPIYLLSAFRLSPLTLFLCFSHLFSLCG
jgi:hypothetical protein